MRLITGLIGAAIGGLIGAGIWVAVTAMTSFEIGWIAWGVGALVGLGAVLGSQRQCGDGLAIAAAGIALVALVVGKAGVIVVEINRYMSNPSPEALSEELLITYIADEVVIEFGAAGRAVDWPAHMAGEFEPVGAEEADYPADVWAEARGRWDAKTPAEREAWRDYIALKATDLITDEFVISYLADDIVDERLDDGAELAWPIHRHEGAGYGYAERDYPEDVWAEAVRRWEAYPEAERQQWREYAQSSAEGDGAMAGAAGALAYLPQTLSLFDLLWAFLALATAFQLARTND